MSSRLGEPVRKKGSGASRFASPVAAAPPPIPEVDGADNVLTSKLQNLQYPPDLPASVETRQNLRAPMREKQGTTIRLTPTALQRLGQLGLELRKEGLRGRQSSASEIIEALVMTAKVSALVPILKELP